MKWWTTFPRKIAYPSKIVCKTAEEFIDRYNKMNGVVNKLYIGIYSCDEFGNMPQVTLNVVSLDIDWEGKYGTMVEIHNKLIAENIKHQVMFSTNGFWIFAACKPTTYDQITAKGKLAAMQDKLIEGTTAFFGKAKDAPVDNAIRGDVERITRMPTSFDKTRGRFARLLSQADIDAGYDAICKLAETRSEDITTFCADGIELDPESFTVAPIRTNYIANELTEEEYKFIIPTNLSPLHTKILNTLPEFMKAWVLDKEVATWEARAYMTLYMREVGYSMEQTKAFLQPFYENMPRTDQYKNNWEHYCQVKVAELMYKRGDMKFPNYMTLFEKGLCPWKYVEAFGGSSSPAYR